MSKRTRSRHKGRQGPRGPQVPSTRGVAAAETKTSSHRLEIHRSRGKPTKQGSSQPPDAKVRHRWRPMTTWAGRVATSVIVAVVSALAVYGVHSFLSRATRADLSAPPVKVEEIEVGPLDDDLLSARVIHSA